MTILVVAKGIESKKVFEQCLQDVTPFVGGTLKRDVIWSGVGLIAGEHVYELSIREMGSFRLIRSWRAMKLLERISVISTPTLRACLEVFRESIGSDKQHIENDLAEKLGGMEAMLEVRKEILSLVPEPAELAHMLDVLAANKVQADADELRDEINLGHLTQTPQVDSVFAHHDATYGWL